MYPETMTEYVVLIKYGGGQVFFGFISSDYPYQATEAMTRKMTVEDYEKIEEIRVIEVENMNVSELR